MTYEDFKKKIEDIFERKKEEGKYSCIETQYKVSYYGWRKDPNWKTPIEEQETRDVISVDWCVGGVTGGSCWGGENYHYTSYDTPKELEALDYIMEEIVPNLTFLQYRALYNEVVQTDSYSDGGDYYGNHSDYQMKFVVLTDLHEYLQSQGWLE